MSLRLRFLTLTAVAISLASCDGSFVLADDADLALEITTNASSYVAVPARPPGDSHQSWGFQIITTIRNTGKGTVPLRSYYGSPLVALSSAVTGQENGYSPTLDLRGESPLLLHPGQQIVDTTFISGPQGYTPGQSVDQRGLEGSYRVVVEVAGCDHNAACYDRWKSSWPTVQVTRAQD